VFVLVSRFIELFSSFLFFFVPARLSRDEHWNSFHLHRTLAAWIPIRMLDAQRHVRLCFGWKPLPPSSDTSETNASIHLGTQKEKAKH
jgi:hypothetical protein